jgi:penicillin-binding protein 2
MKTRVRSGRLRFDERLGLPVATLPGGIADPLAPADSHAEAAGHAPLAGDSSLRIAIVVVLLAFLLLVGRLIYLQVYLGEAYYQKSTNNFIKERDWPAVRGQIRDRRGHVLVENRPAYSVYVTPQFITADVLAKLRRHLDLGDDQFAALQARIDSRRQGKERSQMMLAAENITRDQMALLESEKQELHGVDIVARAHRYYPYENLAAHLLGYLNQAGPEDLRQGYKNGEYVGRAGVEHLLESALRGVPGYEKIVVDAYGRKKSDRELGELSRLLPPELKREPVPGNHVVLTIDLGLQQIVERALSKHRSAAAVVVEADTGKVLAAASYPSPDPNLLTGRLTRAEAQRLESDPFHPLLDKALRETYYPGSTFKIVPALAALEEHLVDPDARVPCYGRYELGRHVFHCMKAHGPMNLQEAIAQSCNVYFYHLAEKVGLERMDQVANAFGFGEKLDLGLGEASGFMPTLDFYKRNGGFRGGYALNTAIGQGAVRASVLQMALAYAALGNGGKLYRPMLIERIEKPSGEVIEQYQPVLHGLLPASPESLERLRRALVDVLADPKGTASSAATAGLDIAGKSGTAQVRKNHRGEAGGWDTGNDHAWFVGFSPSRHARIAVAVLIEHGGLGGHVAAPTAIEIMRGYYDEVAPEERPRLYLSGAPPQSLHTTLPTAAGVQ